jgi:hypothetical protein
MPIRSGPYGRVDYADPGYLADGRPRYPLDTLARVRNAPARFAQHEGRYTGEQRRLIAERIARAERQRGVGGQHRRRRGGGGVNRPYGEYVESRGPQEGDWVTEDHRTVYEVGGRGRPLFRVGEDDDFDAAVRSEQEREGYAPNVWWISDHGNAHLLNVYGRSRRRGRGRAELAHRVRRHVHRARGVLLREANRRARRRGVR